MPYVQGPLPLELQLLGEKAMECRAYAKALHYKEEEFHKGPTSEVLEHLISINNKLGQKEAAAGEGAIVLIFVLLSWNFCYVEIQNLVKNFFGLL